MIYDHVSGKLSSLDRKVLAAVPPGGNWRDLPKDFASDRIKQIRESAARGEGSRSTYYGRLQWDRPSYTISTYFNRPGNGCFIHPSASRLISIREAARLQTFPDQYRFSGNGRSRYVQVGNAVPPLLAFQIARVIEPGPTVDLFAGGGGLSLGFAWAGHEIVAAVDNDRAAIQTIEQNGHVSGALKANLGDVDCLRRVISHIKARIGRQRLHTLIGGPPCQGFSTAGHCRLDDPRNKLVFSFLAAAEALRPPVVVMENVPALLWQGRRATLDEICRRLVVMGYYTSIAILHAEGYGVPQLRRRLILVATSSKFSWPLPWKAIFEPAQAKYQPGALIETVAAPPVTVAESIGDLPTEISDSPDSPLPYWRSAESAYQRWARGELPVEMLLPEVTQDFDRKLF